MESKEWDLEIIKDIFEVRDQHCIVNTRVEYDLDTDILCWKLEATGQYSVKTAYNLIQEQKGAWNAVNNNPLWKNFWNIKAPPKCSNLVWRAVSYCLPTKTALQTKHVQIDNICPVCNEEVESTIHSLVQCKVASLCWQIYNHNTTTTGNMDFTEWLENILTGKSNQNKAKIITMCWSIWRARNDLVWNNKRWNSLRIVAKAWEYLSQWKAAQSRFFEAPITPPTPGDGAILWVKPQQNEVKINVDAAVFENRGYSGIGLIARNHEGHLLLAKTRCFSEIMNPALAEAIAVKEALSWAKEWSGKTITIESDCLVVIQMIRSVTPMRSRLGRVIVECRELLRHLNNVSLYFVKQSANMATHELAQVSHMYPDRVFDWRAIPINVKS